MKTKSKLVLLLAPLMALSFIACGGGGNGGGNGQTTEKTTEKTTKKTTTEEVADLPDPKSYNVTFDLNYEGAPAATVVTVTETEEDYDFADKKYKACVETPATPTRAGYKFISWTYESKGVTQTYDFKQPITADCTFKAHWVEDSLKEFKFEAEYCPCINDKSINGGKGVQGSTYSGGTSGLGLIQQDYAGDLASNGFFVHFLYDTRSFLTFDINSDAAVDNAQIYLALSAEYRDIDFSKEKFEISVNGTVIDYGEIVIAGVPGQGSGWHTFSEYILTTNIPLKEGNNEITMKTINDELLFGTAKGVAPMVDYIKIYTTSNLTWPTQATSNLDAFKDE